MKEGVNKNKNIIITTLTILLIATIGFIAYDKVNLKSDKKNETINKNNQAETNEEINYQSLITEISEVFDFVYRYYDTGNAYCGTTNTSDRIKHPTKSLSNGLWASTQFKSYQEMIDYLKQYMTEEVINKKKYN